MSQNPGMQMREGLPGEGRLGVIDATRMGWRLMMSDFWLLWVAALVVTAILSAAGLVGCIPCIGVALLVFVKPHLAAGLFYTVRHRIDGGPTEVGNVFMAFRRCYWPALVAGLPVIAIDVALNLIGSGFRFSAHLGPLFVSGGEVDSEELIPILVLLGIGVVVFVVVAMIVRLFFTFALLAIWDTPTSGGEAIRTSYRLVKDHFWSVVGLSLLFALMVVGAAIAGLLACCIGLYFTLPIVSVWYTGALIYLYRSWTGQALVQPVAPAEGAPAVAEGPIPPSAIEPPSTM